MLSKEMLFAISALFFTALALGALVVSWLTAVLFRQRWSGRTAAADVLLALALAVGCAITLAFSRVDPSRGPIWIGTVSLVGVIILRVARWRSAGSLKTPEPRSSLDNA